MKSIVSVLFVGLMAFTSALQSASMDDGSIGFSDEAMKVRKIEVKPFKSKAFKSSYGFAIVPSRVNAAFSLSEQVILQKLTIRTKDVSLSQGCIKLQRGVYRLAFGINLLNTGGKGSITAWLTRQLPHVGFPVTISTSLVPLPVDAAFEDFGFSVVQLYGSVFLEVVEPMLICLNYQTTGDLNLFNLFPFESHCEIFREGSSSASPSSFVDTISPPPNPFYLTALKILNLPSTCGKTKIGS